MCVCLNLSSNDVVYGQLCLSLVQLLLGESVTIRFMSVACVSVAM